MICHLSGRHLPVVPNEKNEKINPSKYAVVAELVVVPFCPVILGGIRPCRN